MAIGTVYGNPEEGYTRYDDTSPYISYSNDFSVETLSDYYGGSGHYSRVGGATIEFEFTGTAFRIIEVTNSNRSSDYMVQVYEDGELIGQSTNYNTSLTFMVCTFEKEYQQEETHRIKLVMPTTGNVISLDAIDVKGELKYFVGSRIFEPEAGWKRIDDTDTKIGYLGYFGKQTSNATCYNKTSHYLTAKVDTDYTKTYLAFKFTGTKLRVYFGVASVYSQNVSIIIDGVVNTVSCYDANYTSLTGQYLVFQTSELSEGEHTVRICSQTQDLFSFDCIDIDENGEILSYLGSVLDSPEDGTVRYPCLHTDIVYDGTFTVSDNVKYSDIIGDTVTFYFYGSKFRVIDNFYTNRSNNVEVQVDKFKPNYYSQYSSRLYNAVFIDESGFTKGIHKVAITNNSTDVAQKRLSILNIDVDGYLCTADGEYINVTPIMTSNTAPSPYSIAYSTVYSSYAAWKAFNGIAATADFWSTGSNAKTNQWIQLDFTENQLVNAFSLTMRSPSSGTPSYPLNFILQGSNDGTSFDSLKQFYKDDWVAYEQTIFVLDKSYKYRYYRLYILDGTDESVSTISISELRFLVGKDTSFYLINQDGVYKNINYEKNVLETVSDLNILSEPVMDNPCIVDVSDIITYMNEITGSKGLLSSNKNVLAVRGVMSNREMFVTKNDFYTLSAKKIYSLFSISNVANGASIHMAFSIDGGIIWKTFADGVWVDLPIVIPKTDYAKFSDEENESWNLAMNTILTDGILLTDLENVDFTALDTKRVKFAFVLDKDETDGVCEISSVNWNIDEADTITEVCSDAVQKTIIRNTIMLKSAISADKLYVNINTFGIKE